MAQGLDIDLFLLSPMKHHPTQEVLFTVTHQGSQSNNWDVDNSPHHKNRERPKANVLIFRGYQLDGLVKPDIAAIKACV